MNLGVGKYGEKKKNTDKTQEGHMLHLKLDFLDFSTLNLFSPKKFVYTTLVWVDKQMSTANFH